MRQPGDGARDGRRGERQADRPQAGRFALARADQAFGDDGPQHPLPPAAQEISGHHAGQRRRQHLVEQPQGHHHREQPGAQRLHPMAPAHPEQKRVEQVEVRLDGDRPEHIADAGAGARNEGVQHEEVRDELPRRGHGDVMIGVLIPGRHRGDRRRRPAEKDDEQVRWVDAAKPPAKVAPRVDGRLEPARQPPGRRKVDTGSAQDEEDAHAPRTYLANGAPERPDPPGFPA